MAESSDVEAQSKKRPLQDLSNDGQTAEAANGVGSYV